MKVKKTDLLRGTLDLLVLKARALGPLHGLGVSTRIEQITKGTFQVKPGSLLYTGWRKPVGSNHLWESRRTIAGLSITASPEPDSVN